MPEGPEIHRAADRIRTALAGQRAQDVFFGLAGLDALADGLIGQRVVDVAAHGKAVLTEFEDGRSVFSHNQLYGRWYVVRAGKRPNTRRSLRFMVETSSHAALLYSASTIEVLSPGDRSYHPFLSKLGPDPLHGVVGPHDVLTQLEDRRFSGRTLGALLLDQAFVAGIGNYLRSEILFAARLRADVRPKDLEPADLSRLANAVTAVTQRAYRTGGVTNDQEQVKRMKAAGASRREYRHWVFARGDQPCHNCGAAILQEKVAGRRLYRCPECQA